MKKKLLLIITVLLVVCTPVYAEELESTNNEETLPIVETVINENGEEQKEEPVVVEQDPEPTVDLIIVNPKGTEEKLKNGDPLDIYYATVTVPDVTYTGSALTPEVTVKYEGNTLTKGTDYTVDYSNNINAGMGMVTITGIGEYIGDHVEYFTINRANIANATITVGTQVFPNRAPVTVVFNGTTLVEDEDYTLEYSIDFEASQAQGQDVFVAIITGKDENFEGNFTGSVSKPFECEEYDINDVTLTPIPDQEYTGEDFDINPVLTLNGTVLPEWAYRREDINIRNIGYGEIKITGVYPFYGERTIRFRIRGDIEEHVEVNLGYDKSYYNNGNPVGLPEYTDIRMIDSGYELVENEDYTIAYENNIYPGLATATITGLNIFYGALTVNYQIVGDIYEDVTISAIPNQVFTGAEITPEPDVYCGEHKLVKDQDYTLSYYGNRDASTYAEVIVTGKEYYEGYKSAEFTITAKNIGDLVTSLGSYDHEYTGSPITLDLNITYNGYKLVEGEDFYTTYSDNIKVGGNAMVKITGLNNFQGSYTGNIFIYGNLSNCVTVEGLEDFEYDGNPKELNNLVIKVDESVYKYYSAINGKLNKGEHYKLEYENNIYPGEATVIITALDSWFVGTRVEHFTITGDLSYSTYDEIEPQVFTGSEIEPLPNIYFGDYKLEKDKDYTLSYANNRNVSDRLPVIIVEGKGIFTGTKRISFDIYKADSRDWEILPIPDQEYTGTEIVPEDVVIKQNGNTLIKDIDYTLYARNNKFPGEATLTISGINISDIDVPFRIIRDVNNTTINISAPVTYNGAEQKPYINFQTNRTLVVDEDYTVTYSNNINAGTASLTITGMGYYHGERTFEFTINPYDFSKESFSYVESVYTGKPIKPTVRVYPYDLILQEGTDYTLVCENNTDAGNRAHCTITGLGNFAGTSGRYFDILPANINDVLIDDIPNQAYTGAQVKPTIKMYYGNKILEEGTDYTLRYSANTGVTTTAAITINGYGNYEGSKVVYFTIEPANIDAVIKANQLELSYIPDQDYTGNAITPAIFIRDLAGKALVLGTDYTVAYSNNIKGGTAIVTITGIGNYTGKTTTTFKIKGQPINKLSLASLPIQKYTGKAVTPNVTLKDGNKVLKLNTDYTLSYRNNIKVGTATVTITGKGSYSGTRTTTFSIKYGITYVLNGGKNNTANPSFHLGTAKITFKKPTRVGYTFAGWYKDAKFKKKITYIKKGTKESYTVYAKWTPIKYTIKFNKNGGKGTMAAMKNRKYNTAYTLTNNKFKRTGYVFVGWTTNKNGTGTVYFNKAVVKNLRKTKGTITLYAKWKKQ